jgi:hypothetical protein
VFGSARRAVRVAGAGYWWVRGVDMAAGSCCCNATRDHAGAGVTREAATSKRSKLCDERAEDASSWCGGMNSESWRNGERPA